MPDPELVTAAIHGDRNARKTLFMESAKREYPAAYSILGNRPDAEDAIQSAVVNALEKLPSLQNPGAFRTWFHRITVNQALTLIRRRAKGDALAPDTERQDPGPVSIEEQIDLRNAIARLTPLNRRLLYLSASGFSSNEIARIVDRPAGTVRRLLSESYERVQERMTLGDELEDMAR